MNRVANLLRWTAFLQLTSIFTAIAGGEEVSRDVLLKTLRSSQGMIRDVEYVYEGSLRTLQVPDADKIPAGNRSANPFAPVFFQGRFARRDDGPAHLDLYTWEGGDLGSPSRVVQSLANDGKRLSQQDFEVGGGPIGAIRTEPSWIGSFFRTEYPLYFYVAPLMIALLQDRDYQYSCRGWETEAGRKCLAIDLVNPGGKAIDRFWIDMERQGHVLRYDFLKGGDLIWQSFGIELGEVEAKGGGTVWFPLRGKFVNYSLLGTIYRNPLTEEVSAIVKGTLLINQGLDDSRFRLTYRPDLADAPLVWKKAAEARASKKINGARRNREEFEQLLSEADRKSPQLQAAPSSTSPWIVRNAGQVGMYALGGALIAAALMVRRRT